MAVSATVTASSLSCNRIYNSLSLLSLKPQLLNPFSLPLCHSPSLSFPSLHYTQPPQTFPKPNPKLSRANRSRRRLFVGNLPFSLPSTHLAQLFAQAGIVVSVEIVHDDIADRSKGFAFVTMGSVEDAEHAIQMFDGSEVRGRIIKVNFPDTLIRGKRLVKGSHYGGFVDSPHKIYAGNLGWNLTSQDLREAFAEQPGFLSAKVIYERNNGKSRGYGFVTFETAEDVESAMNAMNGVEVQGRPLLLNFAADKTPSVSLATHKDTTSTADSMKLLFGVSS